MITPCVQTLQSLGTVAGASHQELQCRLHNPDIESRILIINLCVVSDVNDVLCYLSFLSVSLPFLLFMWFCARGFSFAMIACYCPPSEQELTSLTFSRSSFEPGF